MIPQVGGFQGCYLDNHRNNWRCARCAKTPPQTPPEMCTRGRLGGCLNIGWVGASKSPLTRLPLVNEVRVPPGGGGGRRAFRGGLACPWRPQDASPADPPPHPCLGPSRAHAPPSSRPRGSGPPARPQAIDAEAKRKAAYLLLFGLFWFVVWLPAVIIWGLSVAGAPPTTTDWWRIYGAHAIIFHSQQLGNLLLYGFLWRRLMNDYLDSVQQLPKEVKELEVVQGPVLDVAPYNTPVGPQAPPYGYYPPAPTGVPQYPMYPAAAPYTVTYYPSYSAY